MLSSFPSCLLFGLQLASLLPFALLGCSCGVAQESETPPPSFAVSTDARPAHAPSTELENAATSPHLGAEERTNTPRPPEEGTPSATCEDPTLKTIWIGQNVAPTVDWWRKVANVEPRPPRTGHYPGVRAPVVRMGLSGADSLPDVTRKYRQNFGRYRICYEASLSQDPKLAGHWVARVAHAGKVCSLQVIDTNLPQTFSECLAEGVESHVDVPNARGLLEVVLAFQPP